MARGTGSTTRRTSGRSSAPSDSAGLGGMLRGSVGSVMGNVGLNVPLRAVERLTGAIERASTLLERVERATRHLDRLDADFVDRLNTGLTLLGDVRQDTRAMRRRVEALEEEVRTLHEMLADRLDRMSLMRPSRKQRKAAAEGGSK